MKSIKEKAIETERNTHPLFESFSESTGEPVSVYDQDDMISMFEQGATYMLDEIENFMKDLDLSNSAEEKFYKLNVIADIHGFIQKLKEK